MIFNVHGVVDNFRCALACDVLITGCTPAPAGRLENEMTHAEQVLAARAELREAATMATTEKYRRTVEAFRAAARLADPDRLAVIGNGSAPD